MTPALQSIIHEAYALFAPYTIGRTLDVCKACCITDAEEQELVSTPLRSISSDLFHRAYYSSAHSHSERELWEMKHFLPRVLELVSDYDFPTYAVEITFLRLDLNQPAAWTAPGLELLAAFALAYFQQSLAQYPLPGGDSLDSVLIMFGIAHFDLALLLRAWVASNCLASLLHLKDLLLFWVEPRRGGSARLTNAFATPPVNKAVTSWLQDSNTKSAFNQRMEIWLIEGPPLSEADAAELSLTCEVLLQIGQA